MGNRLLPHRHRKAQQRRALCLSQKRTAAHDRRSPRQPPRRAPAMELAANERQRLSHVQAMDAYKVSGRFGRDLFSPINFQVEDEMSPVRERYGEAFWRAHHEAWMESELNQREYCEAYGIPLKAFGNSRA